MVLELILHAAVQHPMDGKTGTLGGFRVRHEKDRKCISLPEIWDKMAHALAQYNMNGGESVQGNVWEIELF